MAWLTAKAPAAFNCMLLTTATATNTNSAGRFIMAIFHQHVWTEASGTLQRCLKHVVLPSCWARCSPEPWLLGSNPPAENADAVAQPGWNSPASCTGSDDHIHQPHFQGHLGKKVTRMFSSKETSSPFNTSTCTSKGSKTSRVITSKSHLKPTKPIPSQSIHWLRVWSSSQTQLTELSQIKGRQHRHQPCLESPC